MYGNDNFRIYQPDQSGNGLHIGVSAGVQRFYGVSVNKPNQVLTGVFPLQIPLPHGVDDLSIQGAKFVPQFFKKASLRFLRISITNPSCLSLSSDIGPITTGLFSEELSLRRYPQQPLTRMTKWLSEDLCYR